MEEEIVIKELEYQQLSKRYSKHICEIVMCYNICYTIE